ncbi:MAG: LamG domain-containing protein [bacterium]|nr:LamG domain-containing protein [bacterium]
MSRYAPSQHFVCLFLLVAGWLCESGAAQKPKVQEAPLREKAGLLVEYRFAEASGTKVHDVSGALPPLDLVIKDAGAVHWISGGLGIHSPTTLNSVGPARRVIERIRKTQQFTVEAWIRPTNLTPGGTAHLIGISNGPTMRNFSLGQGPGTEEPSDTFNMRLRTTLTDLNGQPMHTTPAGVAQLGIQHLVYTKAEDGTTRLFVNGTQKCSRNTPGTLGNWDSSYRLVVASELGATLPWLGDLFRMAIYDTALKKEQIVNNFRAGSGYGGHGHLSVGPSKDISILAAQGQGVVVSSRGWRLHNIGTKPLSWKIENQSAWLKLPSHSGELAPGAQLLLPLSFDKDAIAKFKPGTYDAKILFTNASNKLGSCERTVHLQVKPAGGTDGHGVKPGPHNTGPRAPSALRKVGPITVTEDGTVIENVHIEGPLVIRANNVTVRNFIVDGKGSRYGVQCNFGNNGILLQDGEVYNVYSSCVFGEGFTAQRLNIHESGGDGFKTSSGSVVEYCWVHHIGTAEGAHADANQSRDGTGMVFRGNFFDIPINIGEPYKSNACLIIQTGLGPIDDVLIENNWLSGGNFTLYITDKGRGHGPPTNVRIINNRFGRQYRYGVLDGDGPIHMKGNRWDDTGDLMGINNQ